MSTLKLKSLLFFQSTTHKCHQIGLMALFSVEVVIEWSLKASHFHYQLGLQ